MFKIFLTENKLHCTNFCTQSASIYALEDIYIKREICYLYIFCSIKVLKDCIKPFPRHIVTFHNFDIKKNLHVSPIISILKKKTLSN